jgi:hypothetical protein
MRCEFHVREVHGEEALHSNDTTFHNRRLELASQASGWFSIKLSSHFLDRWRNNAIVFHLSHHLQAARAPLQCVPDFPQNNFPIAVPLLIPEAQLLNALVRQELIPRRIIFLLPRQPVFKTVQLHGHYRVAVGDGTGGFSTRGGRPQAPPSRSDD